MSVADNQIGGMAVLMAPPGIRQVVLIQLLARGAVVQPVAAPMRHQPRLQHRWRQLQIQAQIKATLHRAPGRLIQQQIVAFDNDQIARWRDFPCGGAGQIRRTVKDRNKDALMPVAQPRQSPRQPLHSTSRKRLGIGGFPTAGCPDKGDEAPPAATKCRDARHHILVERHAHSRARQAASGSFAPVI